MNHQITGLILICILSFPVFLFSQSDSDSILVDPDSSSLFSPDSSFVNSDSSLFNFDNSLVTYFKPRIKYNAPHSIYEWRKYEKIQLAGWDKEKIEKLDRKLNKKRSGAFMVIHKGKVVTALGDCSRRFHADAIKKTFTSDVVEANKELLKKKINPRTDSAHNLSVEMYFKSDLTASPNEDEKLNFLQRVFPFKIFPIKRYKSPKPYSTRKPNRIDRFGTSENQKINEFADDLKILTNVDVSTVFFDSIAYSLRMEDFRPIDAYLHPNPTFLDKSKDTTPVKDFYFKISARDLARIGQMYLNDGKWRVFEYDSTDNYRYYGKWIDLQILTPMWISHGTQSYNSSLPRLPQRVGYGYHWWIDLFPSADSTTNFSSVGRGGQLLAVFPDEEVVIVHLSNTYKSKGVSFRRLKKLVKHVFKAKQDTILSAKVPGGFMRHVFGDRLSIIPISRKKIREYVGTFDVVHPEEEKLRKKSLVNDPNAEGLDSQKITKTGKKPEVEKLQIKVKLRENEKRLLMETSWMGNYYLLPIAEDVFLWEDARFRMTFVRNDGGGVSHVIIEGTE